MKRLPIGLFLSLIPLAAISGCATTGGYEKILQTWVGSSESSLINKWGPPSGVFNMSDGKILTYLSSSGAQYSTTYNQFTKSLNTSSYEYWCKTSFTVNSAGNVTNWRWEGNSCRAAAPKDFDKIQEQQTQSRSDFERKKIEFTAKINEFAEQRKANFEKDEYAPLRLKTTFLADDISFERLADTSKITPTTKKLLLKYRTEVEATDKNEREYRLANIGGPADKAWVDYMDSIFPAVQAYNVDLYNGKITWGEYNQKRKDMASKIKAEAAGIYKPSPKQN